MVDENHSATNIQTSDTPVTQHDNLPGYSLLCALKAPSNAMVQDIHDTRSQRTIQMRNCTSNCQKANPWRSPPDVNRKTTPQSLSLQSPHRTTNAPWCIGTRYISHTITSSLSNPKFYDETALKGHGTKTALKGPQRGTTNRPTAA